MCKVTVVIPNYKGEKYLLPCLKSVYEMTGIPVHVIVVDNGSSDSSIETAKERYPQTEFICFSKNYGFCRAVNAGIKASRTPYVILLNNDTKVREGFVENLLHRIEENERYFSVEAKMLQYQDPGKMDSAGTFYNALGWAFARGRDGDAQKYDRPCSVFAACAGAAVYRRDVFEKIGYFDERHFAYLEDIDVGYRARIYGYVNLYEPTAEVIHVGSASSGSRYNVFKTKYSSRNNVYLIYKNMPFLQILLNSPFLLVGFSVKTVFFFRKGLGKEYVKGLVSGAKMCRKENKVPFQKENLQNYLLIQAELWRNLFRKRS